MLRYRIDPISGWIYTTTSLDREQTSTYSLKALASSPTLPSSTTSTAWVVVDVYDVNDNAPVILHHNETIVVLSTARVNDVISSIMASDSDSGDNANLTYRLLGLGWDMLRIDNSDGKVYLNVDLGKLSEDMNLSLQVILHQLSFL